MTLKIAYLLYILGIKRNIVLASVMKNNDETLKTLILIYIITLKC